METVLLMFLSYFNNVRPSFVASNYAYSLHFALSFYTMANVPIAVTRADMVVYCASLHVKWQ